MKCSACKDRLPAYRDGELSDGDRALIAAHIGTCASCAAHARLLADVDQALARVRPAEPRVDFTIGVMARVIAMPVRAPFWSGYRLLAVFLAAEIAALVAGFSSGVLNAHALAASAGTFAGKIVVTVTAIVQVAGDFHLGSVAIGAAVTEIVVLSLAFIAARSYFIRSLRARTYGVSTR